MVQQDPSSVSPTRDKTLLELRRFCQRVAANLHPCFTCRRLIGTETTVFDHVLCLLGFDADRKGRLCGPGRTFALVAQPLLAVAARPTRKAESWLRYIEFG